MKTRGVDKMPDRFSYIKKGYSPEEVDSYIEQLEEIIRAYKHKEKAINNAIVSAQVAADNIIAEAEKKASKILDEAETKLNQMRSLLAIQKNVIDSFYNDYTQLVKKYLFNINEDDMFKIYTRINSLEEKINSVKSVE